MKFEVEMRAFHKEKCERCRGSGTVPDVGTSFDSKDRTRVTLSTCPDCSGRRVTDEWDGTIRTVDVPDDRLKGKVFAMDILELVYYYGQNDFQPVPDISSVSVGDIVRLKNGKRYICKSAGFEEL